MKYFDLDIELGRWPFFIAVFFSVLPFGAGPDGASEGSFLRQIVWGTIFISAALVFLRVPSRIRMAVQAFPLTLFLLLLFVCLSALWSPQPYVSIKRTLQNIGVVTLAAALIVGGSGSYRIHRLATPVLSILMLLSILFSMAFPGFAFSDIGFRAFMATKNNFAQFAVFTVIFATGALYLDGRNKRTLLTLIAASLAGLAISKSVAAISALVAVAFFFLSRAFFRSALRGWWQVFLIGSMSIAAALHFSGVIYGYPSMREVLEFIFTASGRDLSLSGRTDLWGLMWIEAMKHPWFGVGYGGFWLGLEGMSGQIAYLVRWGYPGQAHNGYLDVFNELGLTGIVLLLTFLIAHARNLTRLAVDDKKLANFHISIFISILVINVAEAAILRTTHLWWLIFIASVFEVSNLTHKPASRLGQKVIVESSVAVRR